MRRDVEVYEQRVADAVERFGLRSKEATIARKKSPALSVGHMTDGSLRRLAKRYRREIEDIDDGDSRAPERQMRLKLRDIEREQEVRKALTERWNACDDGVEGSGGWSPERPRPSYGLAVNLDQEAFVREGPAKAVLNWPATLEIQWVAWASAAEAHRTTVDV